MSGQWLDLHWSSYIEPHGSPPLLVGYPPPMSDDEFEEYVPSALTGSSDEPVIWLKDKQSQRSKKIKQIPLDLYLQLDGLNREFAVVRMGSQTLIMQETEDFPEFMSEKDFNLWIKNKIATGVGCDPIPLGPRWLAWPDRRQYRAIEFNPGRPCEHDVYNLWKGFPYPAKQIGHFDVFLDHILKNICQGNREHYEWILDWFADLFQKPYRKLGTCLVMRGQMGVGKGIICKIIGKMLGNHYIHISQQSQLIGKFNAHFANKLLAFADEAYWAGDKAAEGILRALVTEADIPIERKGRDVLRMQSYLRIIMATNQDWAVPTGLGDERRFAVFDVGDDCQGDRLYFKTMLKQLEEGGYNGLMHFFLTREYSDDSIHTIPKTEALLEQKMISMPYYLQWIQDCLHDGYFLEERKGWMGWLTKNEFYGAYKAWCDGMNIRRLETRHWLKKRIQDKMKLQLHDQRSASEGWGYIIPPLADFRAAFEKMLKQKVQWRNENAEMV